MRFISSIYHYLSRKTDVNLSRFYVIEIIIDFNRYIGTFCRPRAVKVGLNVRHRLKYFDELIENHKKTLNDPDRNYDLIYEFLEERNKRIKNGHLDTTFTGKMNNRYILANIFYIIQV